MRRVTVFKYERKEGNTYYDKVEDGMGVFHQWGVNYEEFENGAAPFTTAIIERVGGQVENIPAEMIKFEEA